MKVLAPSIAWFGRLVSPMHAKVTTHVLLGVKRHRLPGWKQWRWRATKVASKRRGLNIMKWLQPRKFAPLRRGRHQMREPAEGGFGSICGSAMNHKDQWILLVLAEIRRIDEDAVLAKTVRTLPLEAVHLPELQCGDLLVEIRRPLRRVRARRHIIKLGRLRGRAAGECDLTFWSNGRIDPEQPGGIYVTQ